MFKHKKTQPGQPLTASTSASAPAPPNAAGEPRTTCYPQDAEEPPAVAGQPRTTVYRQALRWNRGGYDTTN
jgi:hypothetical protein